MKKIRVIIDKALFKRTGAPIPEYLQRTLMPLQDSFKCDKRTITDLLALVYMQFKVYFSSEVTASTLYLTTEDDFFLPPNALVSECLSEGESIRLTFTE